MSRRFLILLAILILLSFCQRSWSQLRKYSAQALTEEQGLAQNFSYGLIQDERGFLWVGTGVGLSRYDGYEVRNFSTKDGLSADFITADFRTSSGSLIFGHNQGGVTLFDGLRFHVLLPDTLGNKVVSITEDGGKNFWIATQSKGLFIIDKVTGEFSHVLPEELQGQIINVVSVRDGMLWVGTNEGLFFFTIHNKILTHAKNDILPPYAAVNTILSSAEDPTLTWVGTSFHGVFLLRSGDKNRIQVHHALRLPELSGYVIQALAQDSDGDLWLGTRQHGLIHLNIGRDRKSVFKMNYFTRTTGFPFTSVNKIIIDRQGQVWVSTAGDGVVKIYKELFTYFPFSADYGVTEVYSIAETDLGYLVASDKGLLQITLNVQSDEYDVTAVDVLKDEPVLSVYTDKQKNTWVGTESKGVFVLSGSRNHLQPVSIDPGTDPVQVRLFEEDHHGNIWMSAKSRGVYVVSKEKKVIRHLTTENRFIHNEVLAIKADSKGNIWFGTHQGGLAMLDKAGELHLFSKDEMLRARDINDIDEDDAGNIWVATEGDGFFKYADNEFTQVGSDENLVSPFIKGIQYDPTGRIWFSYRKGLGYYDLLSGKKHYFTKQDGLLASEAYSSAIIVDSKLNKWFSNDYGITLFEHDTVGDDRTELATYLTGLRIFFKDFPVNLRNENELHNSMIEKLPPLELTHEENHITFDFVAIKLNRTGKIYYRHQLEGYDAEWTPPKTVNFVTYTNLDPGKYTLKVQATDDLGSWVDPITEYSFVITPPYWKETWFYLLQILSVITLFALTYFMGKKGIATKRYVLRLMLFSSFFITLEYVENFIDPLISDFFGGAPVFRFFLNFILALLLLPVETIITHWMMDGKKDTEISSPPQTVAVPDKVMEANEVGSPGD